MNISSNPAIITARSIEEMGDLLKNMTAQTMDIDKKILKTDIAEQASQPGLGETIDVCA